MITPYHIRIAPAAQRQIKALALKQRRHVFQYLESLAINPRPVGAKKIAGMTGLYSESLGSLRIIYKIEEQDILVLLVK